MVQGDSLSLCFLRDEEMDGEWEAPQIPNPACETAPGCGVWKRPMINNPQYKGKWKAPLVDNPNYQVTIVLWFYTHNLNLCHSVHQVAPAQLVLYDFHSFLKLIYYFLSLDKS